MAFGEIVASFQVLLEDGTALQLVEFPTGGVELPWGRLLAQTLFILLILLNPTRRAAYRLIGYTNYK